MKACLHSVCLGLALYAGAVPQAGAQSALQPPAGLAAGHAFGASAHACVDPADPLTRRRFQSEPCALPLFHLPLPLPSAPRAEAEPRGALHAGARAATSASDGHAMFWRFPVQGHGPHRAPSHAWP